MPGHKIGRRWMFTQEEVDNCCLSGGTANRPDTKEDKQ